MNEVAFRCGFVSLLGRPNVGKSTLMNRILGQKVSITSPKPQTTRNQIIGIHNRSGAQAVYLDTPGIHAARKELNRRMVREARDAAMRSDVAVMMIEAVRPWTDDDMGTLQVVEPLTAAKVLVINKVDKSVKERLLPVIEHSARLAVFNEIVPLSAKTGENVDRFIEVVTRLLPEGPALFPLDMVTDQAERFWAAEIIREKLINKLSQELPYATAVVVEKFEESATLIRLHAAILTERESQKPIIIGRGGSMLKEIGTAARKELESFWGIKVYLELFVRVEKNWWREAERER
ncbi:MAG TPA: GTPase Era [bacterium]|nr:GTPase Era [bacterium]